MPKLDAISGDCLSAAELDVIEAAPLPGLLGTPQCSATRSSIEQLLGDQAAPGDSVRPSALAGLWLLAGELDRSHRVSQSIETPTGSYWHGIMHRREGDFNNARYWMRRVGNHPVVAELASHLSNHMDAISATEPSLNRLSIASSHSRAGDSTPNRLGIELIDLCELAVTGKPELMSPLQLICWWEWQLLFQHSNRPAADE